MKADTLEQGSSNFLNEGPVYVYSDKKIKKSLVTVKIKKSTTKIPNEKDNLLEHVSLKRCKPIKLSNNDHENKLGQRDGAGRLYYTIGAFFPHIYPAVLVD